MTTVALYRSSEAFALLFPSVLLVLSFVIAIPLTNCPDRVSSSLVRPTYSLLPLYVPGSSTRIATASVNKSDEVAVRLRQVLDSSDYGPSNPCDGIENAWDAVVDRCP